MTPPDDDYLLPEQRARKRIDEMLVRAGWVVQDYKSINLYAGPGVAVRGRHHGWAGGLGVVPRSTSGRCDRGEEEGHDSVRCRWQTVKYQTHVPDELPALLVDDHLPYGYESTGDETWFTCRFDPEPTARRVFWFHRPETLVDEIAEWVHHRTGALRARIPDLPLLDEHPTWLRDAQAEAIRNLEVSLKANRSRALIQMATGSGKTFCAANVCERLLAHKKAARAKRILFLVDRANLGRQTLKEFQGFEVPGSGRKFTGLYNVQHPTHNRFDPVASVYIGTIQRVYSMLRGEADRAPGSPRQ